MNFGEQVGPKLRLSDEGLFWFCPACQSLHGVRVDLVDWNQDCREPSLSLADGPVHQSDSCRYRLRAGCVEYDRSSRHALAGKTVPMPDLPLGWRDAQGTA